MKRVPGLKPETWTSEPPGDLSRRRNPAFGAGLWVLWVGIVAGMVALYPLQRSMDHRLTLTQDRREELIFLPSETYLPRLAGGYSGLMADLYWTRAVQYYGRHRLAHTKEFSLLGTLLDIATNLDPHLLVAYRFGSLFLAGKPPEGAGDPQRAIYLLDRGIVNNPEYWRLWEDLGFIYYWDMKDYAHAATAFRIGSEQPGALPWMRVLAASVAAKGGEIQSSRILWAEIARSAENDAIRRSAEVHLAALDALEGLKRLNAVLLRYRQKEGYAAHSMQELVAMGYLPGIPVDPSGEPFAVAPDGRATLGPQTRINLGLVQ